MGELVLLSYDSTSLFSWLSIYLILAIWTTFSALSRRSSSSLILFYKILQVSSTMKLLYLIYCSIISFKVPKFYLYCYFIFSIISIFLRPPSNPTELVSLFVLLLALDFDINSSIFFWRLLFSFWRFSICCYSYLIYCYFFSC